jgi:hypothetical protein
MVPSGSFFFVLADRSPLDQGGSSVGPMGPSTLGTIVPPAIGEAVPSPGYLVVTGAPRAQAVSHGRRAESR